MPSASPPYRTSSHTTSPPLPPPEQLLPNRLPFPPLTKSHILHCSYHHWHPKYRHLTPPSILIPLPPSFLTYLRADGILLPPTTPTTTTPTHPDPLTPPDSDTDSDTWSSSQPDCDPSLDWPDVHAAVQKGIRTLGGKVLPKLNWSAPKDATWMVAGNSMECGDAGDVYLLLKSSDFVTHDLEEWGVGCVEDGKENGNEEEGEEGKEEDGKVKEGKEEAVPYHLILRKPLPNFNPACEFRCFVRSRQLLCLCQRDLNYYSFLAPLRSRVLDLVEAFFERELKDTFEEADFVFDVYVPVPGSERVWLIDVNPWAQRTDPILFSWMEVLGMRAPEEVVGGDVVGGGVVGGVVVGGSVVGGDVAGGDVVRVSMLGGGEGDAEEKEEQGSEDSEIEEEEEEVEDLPELRLVGRDDPEAYAFNTPQYSAHKLPKDVVDAGTDGEAGLREFLGTWREIERRQEREDADSGGE